MSDDATLIGFLDDDLRTELESYRGQPFFDTMKSIVLKKQEERDRQRGLTLSQRRREMTRNAIGKGIQSKANVQEHVAYFHTVLALCGFPYTKPPRDATEYRQSYGRNSLIVQAGHVLDPRKGEMIQPGLPYGPKSRLMMLHICTRALRENNNVIDVGDSMSAFIRELGFDVSGGPRGTIKPFKDQMNRLAAANMTIGLFKGENEAITVRTQPIKEISIWFSDQPDQKTLWQSRVALEYEFFQTLKRHALPIDVRVLRAFADSARRIDIILWLDYRVKRIHGKRYLITWELLLEQFRGQCSSKKKFRQLFREDMETIREVFPKLPAQLTDKGILLESRPEGLFGIPREVAIPHLSS